MNRATFYAKLIGFLDKKAMAEAGVTSEEYKHLSWIRFVFTDDKPNANKQGISQAEFPGIIQNIGLMPLKARFNTDFGLGGHAGADIIGFMHKAQQEANAVVGVGAFFIDEYPEVVKFFKEELAAGRGVNFSWEVRYSESEIKDDVTWLKGIIPQALTAVANPAYGDRTPLVSFGSNDILKQIDTELAHRESLEGNKSAIDTIRTGLKDRKHGRNNL